MKKPTYEELERKCKELAKEAAVLKGVEAKIKTYQFIVESAHDAIFFKDLKSRYVIINAKTSEVFGLSKKQIIGKNDYEIMPSKEEAKKNIEDDQIVFNTAKPTAIGKHMTGADKKEYWFQAIKVPQFDDKGNVVGLVGIARDITKRRRAEEALRKAYGELERRVAERTAELVKANRQLRYEIEQRKWSEEALWKSEIQLRLLSSRLIAAQEAERKRISWELHDSIGQSLSAVKFCTENLLYQADENTAVFESLQSIISIVRNAIKEFRRIQADLRPSLLDDLGIVATISWFCREFEEVYKHIRIEKHIKVEEKDVPEHLKIVIFRILQESLNNVTKHAKADLVRVSITGMDGKIELVIKDNGLGFDSKRVHSVKNSKRGFGLSSMKERTEFSGGSFSIESNKGTGTTVRASWQR